MIYNVKKLFDIFFQLKREGYKEVEIMILEKDAEYDIPETICLSVPSDEPYEDLKEFSEIEAIKEHF